MFNYFFSIKDGCKHNPGDMAFYLSHAKKYTKEELLNILAECIVKAQKKHKSKVFFKNREGQVEVICLMLDDYGFVEGEVFQEEVEIPCVKNILDIKQDDDSDFLKLVKDKVEIDKISKVV
jgi:hypothetical protein